MPFTDKQSKFFKVAAHNKEIAKKHGMTTQQARKLMEEDQKIRAEDVKHHPSRKRK